MKSSIVCLLLLSFLITLGCRRSEPNRLEVAGPITINGVEVKRGYIVFTPDTKSGGKGSPGLAFIKDGKYDTRFINGFGVSPGRQVIQIHGFDGQNASSENKMGTKIFTHSTSQIIEKTNLDL